MKSMKWILVGVVCVLASPMFAAGIKCGDGRCQGNESTSCPADCTGSDSGGVRLYGVGIHGDLSGGNLSGGFANEGGDWPERRKKQITLNFAPVGDLDLGFFRSGDTDPFSGRGDFCFPSEPVSLFAASILESKGLARGIFWFEGMTDDEDTVVLYRLALTGLFDPNLDWLPSGTVGDYNIGTMTAWTLGVENEGKEIKNKSCLGAGDFLGDVKITVTREE